MSKIQTLWTFGDSFTFGHGCNSECPTDTYKEYKSYRNPGDDIWPNHLGKILNCEVKNFGKNGGSNDYILNSIIENYDSIAENDYVVIGKTYPARMNIAINDRWENVLGYGEITDNVRVTSTEIGDGLYDTILNFQYYFSNNPLYKKRHDTWFEFLHNRLIHDKKLKKCIIWNVPSTILNSFGTIKTATNGKLTDTHFSYSGHLKFANHIYSKMKLRIL